tara:strand:- start:212 stop:547 length:336 start_codon:yes stop_codon:yes gene_type:complete
MNNKYPFTWEDVGEKAGGDGTPFTQAEKEEIAKEWNKNHEDKESNQWVEHRTQGKTKSRRDENNKRIIESKEDGYPPIEDQLDMLYWDKKNGTNNWEQTIDKIKKRFPKQL